MTLPSLRRNQELFVTAPRDLDSLTLQDQPVEDPGPGMVLVEVEAAGLNFADVLAALGRMPGGPETPRLGYELAGRVCDTGPGVDGLQVGDAVVGMASPPTLRRYVTAPACLLAPAPAGLRMHEAATLPLVFFTAYYGLIHLARLQPGERVLIHAATGGVGLAAVRIARARGAEIYATAGRPEKREYLASLGLTHIFHSRTLDFVEEIREVTQGEGVDVVLNSLVDEAIDKGIGLLRPYGRFLEIGKKDIYGDKPVGLHPFRENLSYHAIDVVKMLSQRPQRTGEHFREMLSFYEDNKLEPLPHRCFPFSEAARAFRLMTRAKHIGKVILSDTACDEQGAGEAGRR